MGDRDRALSCTPSLQWLVPFYHDAVPLLGRHRLDRLYGYTVAPGKNPAQEGQTVKHPCGRVVISLRTHWHKRHGRRYEQEPHTVASILQTFAHELAHLKYWEHDLQHWALCCQLQLQFIKTLDNLGLNDTEAYHAPKETK